MKITVTNKYNHEEEVVFTDATKAAAYIAENSQAEIEEEYNDCLDEGGTVEICGMEYYPSHILEKVDPVAYRCGYADFEDSRTSDFAYDIERMCDGDEEEYYSYYVAVEEEQEEKATA
jgi:hypothetical protein